MIGTALTRRLGTLSEVKNRIGEQLSWGNGESFEVFSPLSGQHLADARCSTAEDVAHAAQQAAEAQKSWGKLTFKQRSQVIFEYRAVLKKNRQELAEICHLENGKMITEALAGVDKALELVDFACSVPALINGEQQQVSRGVQCRSEYAPLGVVASVCPFNFPIMVPHWTLPLVLAVGNSILLKPSELTPLSAMKIAELWQEAGLPAGLLNVIHGKRETVEALCDEPLIKALSFVGSTPVAKAVFRRCSHNLKRVATFGGAKNHIILLPDAHFEMACSDIVASFSGMSGQRCMAASTLIAVGETQHFIEEIVRRAAALKPGTHLPPMITQEAKDKIDSYLKKCEDSGAKILLDGRKSLSDADPQGFYLGASIIDYRRASSMPAEEIFGPTLEIVAAENLSEAVAIQQASPYGNAASLFSQNGRHAAMLAEQLQAGMIGVNIGIPVPRDPFSFGGMKDSHFGYADITGASSLALWTQLRKITTKWNPEDKVDWMS